VKRPVAGSISGTIVLPSALTLPRPYTYHWAVVIECPDIRVNQQQVNASGECVGINRPDLQYTQPGGTSVYIEYDTPFSGRGLPHANRTLANDPTGVVVTKTIK